MTFSYQTHWIKATRWLLPLMLLFVISAGVDAQGSIEKVSLIVTASTFAQVQWRDDREYTPHTFEFIDGQNVTLSFRATGYLPVILRIHISTDMDKELSVTMKPDPRWKRLGSADMVQWDLNQFIFFTTPFLRAEEQDLIGYDPRSDTKQTLTSLPRESQREELAGKYPFLDSSDWSNAHFYYSPSLSPDGKSLLYARKVLTDKGYRKESIWYADLTTGNQVDTQIFDRDGTMNAVWISNDEAMINVLGSVFLFKRNNEHQDLNAKTNTYNPWPEALYRQASACNSPIASDDAFYDTGKPATLLHNQEFAATNLLDFEPWSTTKWWVWENFFCEMRVISVDPSGRYALISSCCQNGGAYNSDYLVYDRQTDTSKLIGGDERQVIAVGTWRNDHIVRIVEAEDIVDYDATTETMQAVIGSSEWQGSTSPAYALSPGGRFIAAIHPTDRYGNTEILIRDLGS